MNSTEIKSNAKLTLKQKKPTKKRKKTKKLKSNYWKNFN